jgi:pimeloyl-ACP methyl ester carboxylesterase
MPLFWIPIIVLALFVLVSLGISAIFSGIILHALRQPIVTTPEKYGLEYEAVAFQSTDGLTLKGWFIPAKPTGGRDKVIILTHPFPFNRHGFLVENQGWLPLFRTDVDLLQITPALHQAGYSVLMFDFRNHGESEGGLTGIGMTEYQDVLGAVGYVKGRPSLHAPQIGFISFCMGADATIVALSKGGDRVADVKFLIAVQPISVGVFLRRYMSNVYTPLSLYLIPIVDRFVQWRGGFAFREMSPLAYAKDVEVPTLVVQAREDPWFEVSDVEGVYDAIAGPKELWWIEGKMRRFEAYNHVCANPERTIAFANTHFYAQTTLSQGE